MDSWLIADLSALMTKDIVQWGQEDLEMWGSGAPYLFKCSFHFLCETPRNMAVLSTSPPASSLGTPAGHGMLLASGCLGL